MNCDCSLFQYTVQKCMLLARHHNAGQKRGVKIANVSFENVARFKYLGTTVTKKKLHGLESARELYRPSERRLSAKCVPTFADRGCHAVSVTDP
jgi:hypothetical protein